MANFNIFSSLVDYQNQLGTVPTNTQDFERFSPGFNLDGVDFLPGIFVTSNLPRVEAFKGSGDTELFILDRQSVEEDSFYKINFDRPYNAVCFDIDSFNPNTPAPAILEIFFADGDSESIEIFPTNATESDPIFFGVVADTEIDNIILTEGPEINGVGNEEIALDNFIVPQQIGDESENQTIIGDSGANILNGGEGNDELNGRRGDDKLRGNSGDDNLNGGLGQDTVVGGSGNDIVNGGRGDDKLLGTSGNDLLLGRSGNDILLGGAGDDILEGGIDRVRVSVA